MNLSEYFKYSVFANLSYIKWGEEASIGTQSDPTPRINGAVEGFRVPEALARQIFQRDQWYIPTSNGFVPNDPSGFARISAFQSGHAGRVTRSWPTLQSGWVILGTMNMGGKMSARHARETQDALSVLKGRRDGTRAIVQYDIVFLVKQNLTSLAGLQ